MKKTNSSIAIALIFFVVGAGIGGTIGMYHGYNLGYKNAISDKSIKSDTTVTHSIINSLNNLDYE